jgi:hypothetical protein
MKKFFLTLVVSTILLFNPLNAQTNFLTKADMDKLVLYIIGLQIKYKKELGNHINEQTVGKWWMSKNATEDEYNEALEFNEIEKFMEYYEKFNVFHKEISNQLDNHSQEYIISLRGSLNNYRNEIKGFQVEIYNFEKGSYSFGQPSEKNNFLFELPKGNDYDKYIKYVRRGRFDTLHINNFNKDFFSIKNISKNDAKQLVENLKTIAKQEKLRDERTIDVIIKLKLKKIQSIDKYELGSAKYIWDIQELKLFYPNRNEHFYEKKISQ